MGSPVLERRLKETSIDVRVLQERIATLENKMDVSAALQANMQQQRKEQLDQRLDQLRVLLREDIASAQMNRLQTEQDLRVRLEDLASKVTVAEQGLGSTSGDARRLQTATDEARSRVLELEQHLMNTTAELRGFVDAQVQRLRSDAETSRKVFDESMRESVMRRLVLEQELSSRTDELTKSVRAGEQRRAQLEDDMRARFAAVEQQRSETALAVAAMRERIAPEVAASVAGQRAALETLLAEERGLRDAAMREASVNVDKLVRSLCRQESCY
jgi:hypothetical protein